MEVEGWERRREAGKSGEGKEGGEEVSFDLFSFRRRESSERKGELWQGRRGLPDAIGERDEDRRVVNMAEKREGGRRKEGGKVDVARTEGSSELARVGFVVESMFCLPFHLEKKMSMMCEREV